MDGPKILNMYFFLVHLSLKSEMSWSMKQEIKLGNKSLRKYKSNIPSKLRVLCMSYAANPLMKDPGFY